MEKLVYVLWKRSSESLDDFAASLRGGLAVDLARLGARRIALSIADRQAEYARGLVITQMDPPIRAVVTFWLDTHLDRQAAETAIDGVAERMAGYLVVESCPIVEKERPAETGERSPGIHTIGFLERPGRLSVEAWLDLWQGRHTRVAVETQSTFRYIQNRVVEPLTAGAPAWAAIVEEGFPAEAPNDPMVFYAASDRDMLERNRGRMIDSCRRFIDFERLESHPFSYYPVSE